MMGLGCVAIGAIAVIAGLWLMRPAELNRSTPAPKSPGQIRAGLRYARSVPDLWVPLTMMTVIGTLAFNFTVVMPLFGHDWHRVLQLWSLLAFATGVLWLAITAHPIVCAKERIAAAEPRKRQRDVIGSLELDVAPDHLVDEAVVVGVLDALGGDVAAVAQDGDGVAEFENFLEPVRDVEDGAAAVAQATNDGEEAAHLALGEAAGGLVECDDTGAAGERLRDFHHLPLRQGQIAQSGVGIVSSTAPVVPSRT